MNKIFNLHAIIRHLLNHPLNRSNKTAAIVRFLKWQLGSRLVGGGGEIIYHWLDNAKIIASPGETGVTGNIYCGLAEFADMAFVLHVLRAGDLFVDIGANAGAYTLLASSVAGAKTTCFEPAPATYAKLLANIRLNDLQDKVVALNLALGRSKGTIRFSSDQDCMNHVIAADETGENVISVNQSTLDEALDGAPLCIKIDVEGYETPTLQGGLNTLKNKGLCAVIMELNGSGNRYGYDEDKILGLMSSYGFKPYAYQPFERRLISLKGKNTIGTGNTLFIRDRALIQERIKTARGIKVHDVSI